MPEPTPTPKPEWLARRQKECSGRVNTGTRSTYNDRTRQESKVPYTANQFYGFKPVDFWR